MVSVKLKALKNGIRLYQQNQYSGLGKGKRGAGGGRAIEARRRNHDHRVDKPCHQWTDGMPGSFDGMACLPCDHVCAFLLLSPYPYQPWVCVKRPVSASGVDSRLSLLSIQSLQRFHLLLLCFLW